MITLKLTSLIMHLPSLPPLALALILGVVITACGDSAAPLVPDKPDLPVPAAPPAASDDCPGGVDYCIPGVDPTVCQYGGEYPNCDPPPCDWTTDPNCDPPPPGGGGSGGGDDEHPCEPYQPTSIGGPGDVATSSTDSIHDGCSGSGGGDGNDSPSTSDVDSGVRDGTGDCPECKKHTDSVHRSRYDQALEQIDQGRCPELYAKAVEYASTFEVWIEERFLDGDRILGEWLNYDRLLGETKSTTAAFWEPHLLKGTEFHITVAHEAAHGLEYSDDNDEAENTLCIA